MPLVVAEPVTVSAPVVIPVESELIVVLRPVDSDATPL